MVTMIGNEDSLRDLLCDLIELDYDAIEAYEAAIERLENTPYRQSLDQFRQDHVRHTVNLSNIVQQMGETPPDGPSAKQILTKGKVILANIAGDAAILKAMLSNEGDTNTAYDRALQNQHVTPDVREVLKQHYADEQKHKHWLENAIKMRKAA